MMLISGKDGLAFLPSRANFGRVFSNIIGNNSFSEYRNFANFTNTV